MKNLQGKLGNIIRRDVTISNHSLMNPSLKPPTWIWPFSNKRQKQNSPAFPGITGTWNFRAEQTSWSSPREGAHIHPTPTWAGHDGEVTTGSWWPHSRASTLPPLRLFQSLMVLSAKTKCLTLIDFIGFTFQELVLTIPFPMRLQSSLANSGFSAGESFYKSFLLPFPDHGELFESLRGRNFLHPSNHPGDLSLPFLGCLNSC